MLTLELPPLPALLRGAGPALAAQLAPPVAAGAGLLVQDLVGRTSGKIATGWATAVVPVARGAGAGVVNPHPGVLPLNNGATWPGPQPPSGPPGSGLLSFAAARTLKYGNPKTGRPPGLVARHWIQDAIAAQHDAIVALVQVDGVRRWLQEGMRG